MTNKRDILAIACRILGLYYLVWGVASGAAILTQMLYGHGGEQDSWILPAQLSIGLVTIISAYVLIRCADGLAALLISEDRAVHLDLGDQWARDLFTVCLRLVGVVVLVVGVAGTMKQFWRYGYLRSQALYTAPMPADFWSDLVVAVVYLILGVHLVGGGQIIVKLTEKMVAHGSGSKRLGV